VPILTPYTMYWFFERLDSTGGWHTVADPSLLEAQKSLHHAGVESLNLQLQFVRTTILGYNAWAGERSDSVDRWPAHVSRAAERWKTKHIADQADTVAYNDSAQRAGEIPLTVRRFSFGIVGPCEGLAKSWGKPADLMRFTERIKVAQAQLQLLPMPADTGWHRLDGTNVTFPNQGVLAGHARMHIHATLQSLLPVGPRTARLLFACEV
jgi:hypothetical protein